MTQSVKLPSTSPYTTVPPNPANGMVSIRGPLPDSDGDLIPDEADNCPSIANQNQSNEDGDAAGDACDSCMWDTWKTAPGVCGCHTEDVDANANGIMDCKEGIFTSYNGQRQKYVVPKTGWYLVEAQGARGGEVPNPYTETYSTGGKGALMQGYFYLDSTELLQVVVALAACNWALSAALPPSEKLLVRTMRSLIPIW